MFLFILLFFKIVLQWSIILYRNPILFDTKSTSFDILVSEDKELFAEVAVADYLWEERSQKMYRLLSRLDRHFSGLFGPVSSVIILLTVPPYIWARLLKATAFFSLTSPNISIKSYKSFGILSEKPMQSINRTIWIFNLRRFKLKYWLN